jgi:hypothetical protein
VIISGPRRGFICPVEKIVGRVEIVDVDADQCLIY